MDITRQVILIKSKFKKH